MTRRAPLLAAAAVLAALAAAANASAAARFPLRFPTVSRVAAEIAQRPVDVYCESIDEWGADPFSTPTARGYTFIDTPTSRGYTVLAPRTCGYLLLLIQDPNGRSSVPPASAEEGAALLVFVHEIEHQTLESHDEGQVECAAFRIVRPVALVIGADRGHAVALERAARVYHEMLPPQYRTVC